MALVVLEDQLQDVVQIDLLALQQVDLEGDLIPVQLALLSLLRLTTMVDPVTYIIVGRAVVLGVTHGDHLLTAQALHSLITQIILSLQGGLRLEVVTGERLQLTQGGILVVVLQGIVQAEVLAEELDKGELIGIRLDGDGVGEALT